MFWNIYMWVGFRVVSLGDSRYIMKLFSVISLCCLVVGMGRRKY